MERKRTSLSKNLEIMSNNLMNELIESGADAVIVISTYTQRGKSKMSIRKVGNDLLCDSMLRHAFHLETIQYVDCDEDSDE